MGWLGGVWAGLRQRSVAGQTRPREVWSTHGGRRRQVTVVWPAGERGLWRHDAVRALWLVAACVVVAALSIAVVEVIDRTLVEADLEPDDPLGDPTYGALLFAAFIVVAWVAIGIAGVVTLVRRARARRRADAVDGTVVLRRRVQHLGDGSPVDTYFLAVDHGTDDTVTAFRVDPHVYRHLTTGDVVRLTVAAGRRVLRIEALHDQGGQPLPPLGWMPDAPPGTPLTSSEVAQAIRRTVRRVTAATAPVDGELVSSWTFHLVDDSRTQVQLHVANGEPGAAAIVALAAPQDRTGRPVAGLGDSARRYTVPSLLVVRRGAVTIGIQKSPFLAPPTTRWDEQLARTALSRLRDAPGPGGDRRPG